jgi:hypothetical protein
MPMVVTYKLWQVSDDLGDLLTAIDGSDGGGTPVIVQV